MVVWKIIQIVLGFYFLVSLIYFFTVLRTQGRRCGENQPKIMLLPDLQKFTRKIRKRFMNKFINRDRNRFAP
jgi:hypothetical protein